MRKSNVVDLGILYARPDLSGGNLNIKLLKQSHKALRSHLPLGGW